MANNGTNANRTLANTLKNSKKDLIINYTPNGKNFSNITYKGLLIVGKYLNTSTEVMEVLKAIESDNMELLTSIVGISASATCELQHDHKGRGAYNTPQARTYVKDKAFQKMVMENLRAIDKNYSKMVNNTIDGLIAKNNDFGLFKQELCRKFGMLKIDYEKLDVNNTDQVMITPTYVFSLKAIEHIKDGINKYNKVHNTCFQ